MNLFCPKCHFQFSIDEGQLQEKKPEPKKKTRWTFKRIIQLFLSVTALYVIGYIIFNTDLVLKHQKVNQKSKQETVQKIAEKPKQDMPDKKNERIIYLDE